MFVRLNALYVLLIMISCTRDTIETIETLKETENLTYEVLIESLSDPSQNAFYRLDYVSHNFRNIQRNPQGRNSSDLIKRAIVAFYQIDNENKYFQYISQKLGNPAWNLSLEIPTEKNYHSIFIPVLKDKDKRIRAILFGHETADGTFNFELVEEEKIFQYFNTKNNRIEWENFEGFLFSFIILEKRLFDSVRLPFVKYFEDKDVRTTPGGGRSQCEEDVVLICKCVPVVALKNDRDQIGIRCESGIIMCTYVTVCSGGGGGSGSCQYCGGYEPGEGGGGGGGSGSSYQQQVDQFLNNLNSSQLNYISSSSMLEDRLFQFLAYNGFSQDSKNFAIEMIDISIDEINWMQYENNGVIDLAFLISLEAYVDGHFYNGNMSNSFFASINGHFPGVNMIDPTIAARYAIHLKIEVALLRQMYPGKTNRWYYWQATHEVVHTLLDLGGLIPVVGEVFDITNGFLYLINGESGQAAISFASAVPFVGWFASGAKYAYKGVHRFKLLDNGVVYFGKRNSKKVRKILNLGPFSSDPRYAHHIIPWGWRNHDIVQKAAKSNSHFHMDDLDNLLALPAEIHTKGHNLYSGKVKDILDVLNESPLSDEMAYTELINLNNYLKNLINSNPNMNLGQIANIINYP